MSETYIQSLLGDREKIIRISRQHWFRLISAIFLEIVLILIIFSVTVALSITIGAATPGAVVVIAVVGFIALLFPLATMVRDILIWSHHTLIITNHRIMQVTGIFNKNVIDSSLEKVNDVKMTQSALGRMFNYGDIEILTASELGANLFRKIDDPVGFKTAMLNAKDLLSRGEDIIAPIQSKVAVPAEPSTSVAAPAPAQPASPDVPALITQLAQLRQQGILTEEEFISKKAELLKKL